MGAEITDAKPLDAPALKPLKLANRLAGRPERPPTYGTTIQSSDGQEVVLGDPRATRALVALMERSCCQRRSCLPLGRARRFGRNHVRDPWSDVCPARPSLV